ncbi:hypothetical protein Tco_0016810 [Tanacetum coccineum]
MGDENPIRTLGDYSRHNYKGYRNTIELPDGNNVVLLRSDTIRLVQNGCLFHRLRSEDPNQHLKDFLKLVDSLDLDVANRERTRLPLFQFSFHDQKLEMALNVFPKQAPSPPGRTNLTTHFIAQFFPPGRTAKLRNDILMFQQHQVQFFYDHVNPATRQTIDQSAKGMLHDRNAKESWALLEDLALYDNERGLEVEYFDIFPTRSKLTYHKYLMYGPIPSLFLRNPIIVGGCPSNLKIPCNIGHVHVEKAYIDCNSPLNVMTYMQYNWIMRKQLKPREDPDGIRGVSNFTGRIGGMHIFEGNFTYVLDFMIVEDISSVIDLRFTNRIEEISYKMPHKIEKYNSLSDLEKEHTKLVYFRNEEDKRRGVEYVMSKILGFYKECLELGPKYLTGLEDEGGIT